MPVTLLSAAELWASLQSNTERPLVLEAMMGSVSGASEHIPGAVAFCLSEIDRWEEDDLGEPAQISGNYSLREPSAVRAALERHGVTAFRRQVVVYTQCRRHTVAVRSKAASGHHHRYVQATVREGVADPIVAARLIWALALAGVEDVAWLDGGLSAWHALGLPTVPAPVPPTPAADFLEGRCDCPFPRHPEYGASTDEVVAAALAHAGEAGACRAEQATSSGSSSGGSGGSSGSGIGSGSCSHLMLADVRSWREFTGCGHDYAYAMPVGRLPGAIFAGWGPSTFVGSELYRLQCGSLRPLSEVATMWRKAGLLRSPARPPHMATDDGAPVDAAKVEAGSDATDHPRSARDLPEICPRAGSDATDADASALSTRLERELLRDLPEIADASAESTRLVFYCGSGWRSALAWMLAMLMRHPNASSWDGGLFEWALDTTRPLELGEPGLATRRLTTCAASRSRPPEGGFEWALDAPLVDDSCDDEGPAGRQVEKQRRRQRALAQGALERMRPVESNDFSF
jgi:3-mercaptopyruvate sulfurtransferase SseA